MPMSQWFHIKNIFLTECIKCCQYIFYILLYFPRSESSWHMQLCPIQTVSGGLFLSLVCLLNTSWALESTQYSLHFTYTMLTAGLGVRIQSETDTVVLIMMIKISWEREENMATGGNRCLVYTII